MMFIVMNSPQPCDFSQYTKMAACGLLQPPLYKDTVQQHAKVAVAESRSPSTLLATNGQRGIRIGS